MIFIPSAISMTTARRKRLESRDLFTRLRPGSEEFSDNKGATPGDEEEKDDEGKAQLEDVETDNKTTAEDDEDVELKSEVQDKGDGNGNGEPNEGRPILRVCDGPCGRNNITLIWYACLECNYYCCQECFQSQDTNAHDRMHCILKIRQRSQEMDEEEGEYNDEAETEESGVTKFEERLTSLEEKFEERFTGLEGRFTTLEETVNKGLAALMEILASK